MVQTGGKSIRMEGHIGRDPVKLLVDCRASLSFINPRRVEELRLSVTYIPPLFVRIANGDRMPCYWHFDSVPITIQAIEFNTTLYGLNVCNLGVVLGLPWLEVLGPVFTDYTKLTMKFEREGQLQILRGKTPTSGIQAVTLLEVTKEWKMGASVFVLMKGDSGKGEIEKVSHDVRRLLDEYGEVLKEPKELPPPRIYDHKIVLKDESKVVNVPPPVRPLPKG